MQAQCERSIRSQQTWVFGLGCRLFHNSQLAIKGAPMAANQISVGAGATPGPWMCSAVTLIPIGSQLTGVTEKKRNADRGGDQWGRRVIDLLTASWWRKEEAHVNAKRWRLKRLSCLALPGTSIWAFLCLFWGGGCCVRSHCCGSHWVCGQSGGHPCRRLIVFYLEGGSCCQQWTQGAAHSSLFALIKRQQGRKAHGGTSTRHSATQRPESLEHFSLIISCSILGFGWLQLCLRSCIVPKRKMFCQWRRKTARVNKLAEESTSASLSSGMSHKHAAYWFHLATVLAHLIFMR